MDTGPKFLAATPRKRAKHVDDLEDCCIITDVWTALAKRAGTALRIIKDFTNIVTSERTGLHHKQNFERRRMLYKTETLWSVFKTDPVLVI